MANRRMFSKDIVCSDLFLSMPLSTQALYFQLGMAADDDGFLSGGQSIIRMIGAAIDDLKLLLVKKFIISFDSGIIVVRHWRQNNIIKNDRYHETNFRDEKACLKLSSSKTYDCLVPEWFQDGSIRVPQIRSDQVRLLDNDHQNLNIKIIEQANLGEIKQEFGEMSRYIKEEREKNKDDQKSLKDTIKGFSQSYEAIMFFRDKYCERDILEGFSRLQLAKKQNKIKDEVKYLSVILENLKKERAKNV